MNERMEVFLVLTSVGWLVDESVISCGCNVEIEINMDFRNMFDWNSIFSLFVQVYVCSSAVLKIISSKWS